MKKSATPIAGAYLIELDYYEDHRGFFVEPYNYNKFLALGIRDLFVQDSHSFSKKGVLRGMHFQYQPKAMSKMVRCTRGKIYDVIVDMRRNSPTFKKWYGVELSPENRLVFYIPAGCAHGFYAIEESEMTYKCGEMHSAEHDAAIRWDDPEIGIVWPVQGELIISERDKMHPTLAEVVDKVNAMPYPITVESFA
jgi:dTDP-4-dehydrorhamnose 3,5-epimerase